MTTSESLVRSFRLFTLFTLFISLTYSLEVYIDPNFAKSDFATRQAVNGLIHTDTRPAPPRPTFGILRRDDSDPFDTTTTEPSSSTLKATSTTTTPSSASVTVITTPLPSPFDTSLGSNFTTTSCPAFFNAFLSNSTFRSCVPISLMLQNSNSFFRAERSETLLSETLDSACNSPLSICSPVMADLASQLISDSNCGSDFKLQNPIVAQAYAGMISYEPVYRATCLQDPETKKYCFSEAVTNSNNTADSFVYYTAIGLPLPSGAQPTCSTCLQNTMKIFADYAKQKMQPLANTYLGCANQVNSGCGLTYSDASIQVGSEGTSGALQKSVSPLLTIGLATCVMLWLA